MKRRRTDWAAVLFCVLLGIEGAALLFLGWSAPDEQSRPACTAPGR